MAWGAGKLGESFPRNPTLTVAAHRGMWPVWTFLPLAHSHTQCPLFYRGLATLSWSSFLVCLSPWICTSWQNFILPTVTPCLLELSKSQNDMTSEKHLLAMDPRQCVVHTERRSQSDTAVNVTSRVCADLLDLAPSAFMSSFLAYCPLSAFAFLLIENFSRLGQSVFRHT